MNTESNANVTSLVTLCAIVVSVYCIRKNYILYILRCRSSLLSFSYIYLVEIYKNNEPYEFVKADYLKYYEKLLKNSNVIKLLNFFLNVNTNIP